MTAPRPDLGPGWVDRLTLPHGETNGEQLMRARGCRPFKERGRAAYAVTVRRGAQKGAASRRVDRVLGVEPEDE